MDLAIRCQRLPMPGETIMADSAMELCGGKGANQAVAAARAGGDVVMIGRVGDDAFGNTLIRNLADCGVDTSCVTASGGSSGVAVVAVEDSGQNSIMVVPGANAKLTADDLRRHQTAIESADVLLVQLEVPLSTVAEAIRIANTKSIRVILDPAPAPDRWPGELNASDALSRPLTGVALICPNESEVAKLTGLPVNSLEEAEIAARALYNQGVEIVVVTLAEKGVLVFEGQTATVIPTFSVHTIDTTAAGDAFAGALAVRWAENDHLLDAIRFASAAGAIATTRVGAQSAMATRSEIEMLIQNSGRRN
jgi:ribokinase